MKILKQIIVYLLIYSLILSCSSNVTKEQHKIRKYVVQGDYQKALKLVSKRKFLKRKNKLLHQLEKGLILHHKGDYRQSNKIFYQAQNRIQELFTKDISKKIESFIKNDNYDLFYAMPFEQSLHNYFISLNHFLQASSSVKTKNFKRNLMRARSQLMFWDSKLDDLKHRFRSVTNFKGDVLSKIFAGLVHENMSDRYALQTASILYKNAIDFLNEDNQGLLFDSEREALKSYFEYQISQINNKKFKRGLSVDTTFWFHLGLMAPKIEKKLYVEGPKSKVSSVPLPYISPQRMQYTDLKIEVIPRGDIIPKVSFPLLMVSPVSKMAAHSLNSRITSILNKAQMRVVSKQLLARVGTEGLARGIMTKTSNDGKKLLILLAAFIILIFLYALIEKSERADLRFWSTLPHEIRFNRLNLRPGHYLLNLRGRKIDENGDRSFNVDLAEIEVKKNKIKQFFYFKIVKEIF